MDELAEITRLSGAKESEVLKDAYGKPLKVGDLVAVGGQDFIGKGIVTEFVPFRHMVYVKLTGGSGELKLYRPTAVMKLD